jgi:protein-S-isoprenylcysteine O-methyltransferase Ste14
MTTVTREPIPFWARFFLAFADISIFNAPGRPFMKVAWAVNLHKIFTLFIIYAMMSYYANFSVGAWVFLGLHGIYGYCWLIKDLGFRDHQLENKLSFLGFINLYLLLIAWYWLMPWLFIARGIEPSSFMLFFAIAIHTLGVVTMIAGDGQRHWILKYRNQPGLIQEGMYRYTRNPNYLGELMLYAAYALLASHWIAWVIYGYMAIYFLARMKGKDNAISRHSGWAEYKAQSGLVIPWALLNGRAIMDRVSKNHKKAAGAQLHEK